MYTVTIWNLASVQQQSDQKSTSVMKPLPIPKDMSLPLKLSSQLEQNYVPFFLCSVTAGIRQKKTNM